jgi:hypothetical protein
MEFASERSSTMSSTLPGTVRGWSAYALSIAAREPIASDVSGHWNLFADGHHGRPGDGQFGHGM